jgi:hypothetical protein
MTIRGHILYKTSFLLKYSGPKEVKNEKGKINVRSIAERSLLQRWMWLAFGSGTVV